jgi:hypothetical protein
MLSDHSHNAFHDPDTVGLWRFALDATWISNQVKFTYGPDPFETGLFLTTDNGYSFWGRPSAQTAPKFAQKVSVYGYFKTGFDGVALQIWP